MTENREKKERAIITHGAELHYVGSDGIKRAFEVIRFKDGSIQIEARSWWNGDQNKPVRSGIRFGEEAFDALGMLIDDFRCSRNSYAITPETDDKTK